MLTEPGKVEVLENCSKMQSLSSAQLPELIKSFDSKFNQQKDVPPVKSGKPAKMKLRDAREVLEIARLKVLVSEMREKAVKLEAQLLAAAKQSDKSDTKSKNVGEKTKDLQDSKKDLNKDGGANVEKIYNKNLSNREGHTVGHMSSPDVKRGVHMPHDMCMTSQADDDKREHVVQNIQDDMYHNMDLQSMTKNNMDLLKEQDAKLDKDIAELRAHIKNLQCNVDEMLLELPEKLGLQKDLSAAKERVKGLQEEMKDDAGLTKAQLLLLKQQFGELEVIQIANERKELEFHKASQLLSALEAEVEELRNGKKELLQHKQELSERLLKTLKKAEKITPVTKDDVLAAQAEVSALRSTNIELQKKVEILQMNRFNEVEELVYLRWVNACLRHDLDTYKASRRNSEDISEQSKKSVPLSHGKDGCDLISRTTSGCSFTSYSDVHEYLASQNDDEERTMSCESTTKSSPQIAMRHGHANSRRSSPIAIEKQGHLNTSYASPITHGHVNSSHAPPLSFTHGHVNSSHTSPQPIMHGHVKNSHTSPQMPNQGIVKTKSGPLLAAQQLSPSNSYLSQSPEPYNPRQYSLDKTAVERDPRRLAEIQSRLSFNNRSAKSNTESSTMTTSTSHSRRRSGISFNRSASSISSYSEASINRMHSPQKQDIKRFTRSSSTLSSDSDISISSRGSVHAIPARRHSASSGMSLEASSSMSLLDEYLHKTNTRGLNRSTSRFSAVLPNDRQFSDSASVPFPTINEGVDPPKRKEHTNMKARSFEINIDASDRVVASFQALCASSQKNAHRTFKDVSRRNSYDDKTADNGDEQMTHEHQPLYKTHVDSNDNAMSRESEQSQSSARSSQADFFCDLARAIQATRYRSIDKVAAFINWFDRQGDVEKQEFFSFPDCPKDKVEAMRRAVYEYEELQALESDLSSYKDDLKSPTDLALKDMKSLLEKVENHIQGFKQARELAITQFNELDIPTYWMLDSEMIAKIKGASLKLAQKYINRVLDALEGPQTETEKKSQDDMLLQAARFLLQIHNFAGGFDEHTASAFRMLQSQGGLHDIEHNNAR